MTEQIKELVVTLARLTGVGKDELAMRLVTENAIDAWADDLCTERGISTDFGQLGIEVQCFLTVNKPTKEMMGFAKIADHPFRREAVTVARLKALIKSYEVEK